jgi:acyl carrier protein
MITQEDVLVFVQGIIEEVKDFEGVIDFDTTLEALALDSLDYVQTQIEAKKRYGVDLNAELFISGQITTVGQLCAYIAEASQAEEQAPDVAAAVEFAPT